MEYDTEFRIGLLKAKSNRLISSIVNKKELINKTQNEIYQDIEALGNTDTEIAFLKKELDSKPIQTVAIYITENESLCCDFFVYDDYEDPWTKCDSACCEVCLDKFLESEVDIDG
jgi:hypothetical protein